MAFPAENSRLSLMFSQSAFTHDVSGSVHINQGGRKSGGQASQE